MRVLVDAQLPRRLAHWLRAAGHDVVHTEELVQKNRTPDSHLLSQANQEDRVLITKDADFQSSFELGQGPPRLLLITTGNIHNDELLALFSRHEHALVELFATHSFLELSRTQIVVHR